MTPEIKAKIEDESYKRAAEYHDPLHRSAIFNSFQAGGHFSFDLGREEGIREVIAWIRKDDGGYCEIDEIDEWYADEIEKRFLKEKKND